MKFLWFLLLLSTPCFSRKRAVGVKTNDDSKLRDELALLSVDDYDDISSIRSEHTMDFSDNPEWEYKFTEKKSDTSGAGGEVNPDSKLESLDLPRLQSEGSEQEWSYRRIRDLIALLHVGMFEYADRLSSYSSYSTSFKGKYLKCRKRLNVVEHELKNIVQDKIKLQDLLKDLNAKYNMLEHALKKAGDINQDNKETIEKIRVNRDKCIQTIDNRNDVVTSLRNQNAELRRHLSTLRSSKFGK